MLENPSDSVKGRIVMTGLFDNEKEQKIHENAIAGLALQYHMDCAQMRTIYLQELSILKPKAKVKSFLSVLCCRLVHNRIKQ